MAMPMNIRLDRRVVEPEQRMVAGRYGWAVHRFPVRGGITVREMLRRSFCELTTRPNALFLRVQRGAP